MNRLFPSEKIYITNSKIIPSQRGVFAKTDIKKGEIIEVCPVIKISKDDTTEVHEESLVSYMFYFGKEKNEALIALGFGSIYNHIDNPNAMYRIKPEESVIEFIAIKDIKKDEEISVNYAENNENLPLWFANK